MEVKEEEDNLEKEGEGRNKREKEKENLHTTKNTHTEITFECPKLLKSYLSTLASLFLIQNFFKNS